MGKLKIITWNVNGIRAIMKKEFMASFEALGPDVLCLQETKATGDEVKKALEGLGEEYAVYANESKARKGYSGTAIISRIPVKRVFQDMGDEEHDREGRVIAAEFDSFYLVNVYTPNSGQGLKRLDYRSAWDKAFKSFIISLEKDKPVIVCGDLNVAHQEIDLARPKQNYNKTSGYTQIEIDGISDIMEAGYTDAYRHTYPETVGYTYWNYMFNARARNVGWRIDYFLVSNALVKDIADVAIEPDFMGSDHCPVSVWLEMD